MKKIIKSLLAIVLVVVVLMPCMTACSPKNGNGNIHGVWYVREVEYEGERYHVVSSSRLFADKDYPLTFADKDYPLTYDCLRLTFYEDGGVELYGVHFGTLTGKLTKFRHTGGLGGSCEFEFTIGEKKYSGDIYEPLMSIGSMRVRDTESGNCAFLERSASGYSYEGYLSSLEFGKVHTPSGRWYVQKLGYINQQTGNREHVDVSQMEEYKGALFTKERYIVDFDAENQRLVLSILDIETNSYIEKEGTFKAYRYMANWRGKGTFSDGTEFDVEKTMQKGAALRTFFLKYQDEIIYWEYEFSID